MKLNYLFLWYCNKVLKFMVVSKGSEFKLKFAGDLHEINANTFINSLVHNITILQEINH